jgi:serine/threonine-protein kinase SRPK3
MSQFLRRVFGRRNSNPRVFPDSGFEVIDASEKVEEESLLNYKREDFYPVRIGQIFKSRYQVIGKLGYGTSATLWLCRDLKYDYLPVLFRI